FVPASCTPKHGSPSNLLISANSPLRRCLRRRATVISLIVTRAPSSTHRRRYGRFEPLVIGAITTAPVRVSRRFTLLFSALSVPSARRASLSHASSSPGGHRAARLRHDAGL